MKKILLILLFALTSIVCNAKNPITPCVTLEAVNDKNIPKDVKKWLKAELANTTTSVLENFETPAFYTKKKAKIIGYIKGYDQTLGAKTGIFYYTNQLTNESKPRALEIHEDGRFELELPLEYPMQYYFVIEKQGISFYLEPGQNLSIILNWEDLIAKRSWPFKKITYQGALKDINTHLLHYKPNYNSGNFQKKEGIMQPLAFKKYMLQFKTNALNKVKAYEQSGEIDKKTSELLKNEVVLQTYYSLFDYYSSTHSPRYGGGKRKANNIDDTLPVGYYDFIKDLPLHKQSILVSNRFGSFINRLEYAPQLKSQIKNRRLSFSSKDLLKFIENKGVKISTEDRDLIDKAEHAKIEKKELPTEIKNKISEFYKKNQSLVKQFSNENMETQKKNNFTRTLKEEDSLAANLDIKNNLIYEIIKSRKLKYIMEFDGMYKDKAWYWSELKKGIKSPHLIKQGDDLFKRELEKPEFYELPENEPGTAIFKLLIAPYKGKIVVVQFWHPHSYYQGESLARTKERRNKYKNNENIVFLNITNTFRSSLQKYKESVEKNGFKNSVRISQDDYNYLRQLFKFNTSIKDVLIAKDGVTVSDNFRAHNIEYVLRDKYNIEPDN